MQFSFCTDFTISSFFCTTFQKCYKDLPVHAAYLRYQDWTRAVMIKQFNWIMLEQEISPNAIFKFLWWILAAADYSIDMKSHFVININNYKTDASITCYIFMALSCCEWNAIQYPYTHIHMHTLKSVILYKPPYISATGKILTGMPFGCFIFALIIAIK